MAKSSSKTNKIKAAIVKGTPVVEIARKYEVTPAYVYTVRKRMNVQPKPRPAARTPRAAPKPAKRPMLTMPLVSPAPLQVQVAAPAVVVAPPPSRWRRLMNFFRGQR